MDVDLVGDTGDIDGPKKQGRKPTTKNIAKGRPKKVETPRPNFQDGGSSGSGGGGV